MDDIHDFVQSLDVFEIKDIEKAVKLFSDILNAYHDYPSQFP